MSDYERGYLDALSDALGVLESEVLPDALACFRDAIEEERVPCVDI